MIPARFTRDEDGNMRLRSEFCIGHRERTPELCPGCGESVTHPLYPDCYADDVRLIGQPHTGWHNICACEMEALERKTA